MPDPICELCEIPNDAFFEVYGFSLPPTVFLCDVCKGRVLAEHRENGGTLGEAFDRLKEERDGKT